MHSSYLKNIRIWYLTHRKVMIASFAALLVSLIFPNNACAFPTQSNWSFELDRLGIFSGSSTVGRLESPYRYRDGATPLLQEYRPSSDGIGKVYMGREIAQVMGYQGAAWLERPSRLQEERPHLLVANLAIQPSDVIADIGAGTGYLSARLAAKVPQGHVLAVDVQPEMISLMQQRLEAQQLDNVEPILATEDNANLPKNSVDMAIMLDVYHELAYPYELMQSVVQALRPGGKMVLVEYRGENPFIPIKRLHKMTEKQVKRELAAVGLNWVATNEDLPKQHLIVFEKPSVE